MEISSKIIASWRRIQRFFHGDAEVEIRLALGDHVWDSADPRALVQVAHGLRHSAHRALKRFEIRIHWNLKLLSFKMLFHPLSLPEGS